jgi:signal peptidase I
VTDAAQTDDAAGGADEPSHDTEGMSRSTRSLIEWVAVIVGALVVALVVKTFLVQAFYIPSESMVPTLEVRDRVLVNKLSYDFGDVSRGDVVVFDRPGGPGSDGIAELIKRVVALEGETVEARDNQVFVDGEAIDEGYLPDGTTTSDFGPETIPEDHVWVMGDNRSASDDSRRFKSIPEDDIVGKAFVIIWPLSEVGFL